MAIRAGQSSNNWLQLRLDEAKSLLAELACLLALITLPDTPSNARLKAVIASNFVRTKFLTGDLVNKVYTHDLTDLLRLAGLKPELQIAQHSRLGTS